MLIILVSPGGDMSSYSVIKDAEDQEIIMIPILLPGS